MSILDKFKTAGEKKDLRNAVQPVTKDLTVAQLQEQKEKEAVASGAKKVAKKKKGDTALAYRFLLKPIITEKATYLGSENKYIFLVAPDANKYEVKKAIQKLYSVSVIQVNIINNDGKKVRFGRIMGRTKATKKAIVTLKKGQAIELYEGV